MFPPVLVDEVISAYVIYSNYKMNHGSNVYILYMYNITAFKFIHTLCNLSIFLTNVIQSKPW